MPTKREEITSYLQAYPRTAKELAALLGMKITEVISHLEHVKRSTGKQFQINPAQCSQCDFVFRKREKLNTPSKCPQCKGQRVEGPWLRIEPE